MKSTPSYRPSNRQMAATSKWRRIANRISRTININQLRIAIKLTGVLQLPPVGIIPFHFFTNSQSKGQFGASSAPILANPMDNCSRFEEVTIGLIISSLTSAELKHSIRNTFASRERWLDDLDDSIPT